MDTSGLVLVIVVFGSVIIDIARSEHFRGGTMSWRATVDGQVEVTYRLAWKADTLEGEHDCSYARVAANTLVNGDNGAGLRLRYPDIPDSVWRQDHTMPYHCTARHESADYPTSLDRSWVMGQNSLVLAPPPDGRRQFEFVYQSCCWVSNLVNYGPPRNWDFVMSVDLEPRVDTGRVNIPPVTTGLPVQRVSKGCNVAVLSIPTYDADGDDVTCRWIDSAVDECRDNCRVATVWRRSIWQLVNRNGGCKLIIRPATAEVGWYAVAMQIEDSVNGNVLSKVPFQFMLEITGDATCTKPSLISPPLGACWVLTVGEPFAFNLTARTAADGRISDISTTSIMGMQKSPIRLVPGSTTDYYVTMTWTPTENDIGVSLFCFQPEDDNGFQGTQRCLDIYVGDQIVPEPIGEISNPPAGRSVLNITTAFEIIFDSKINWPSQDSEIRLLLAADKSEVYTVKVESDASSGNVLISYNAILFSIPDGLLVNGVNYTLDLPAGLARGYGSCSPWSKAASWDFFVGAGAPGLRPNVTTEVFLQNPQCFGTYMQIFVPKTMIPYQDPTMMHLNEPTCLGSEHNGTHFVMKTDYQYCGTQIETVPYQRKSIISNTIRIPSLTLPGYPHATRRNVTLINMVCEMDNDRITFVRFDADIPAIVHNRTGSGAFNFSLRMFPDDSFTPRSQFKYEDYPVNVDLTQRLYFEAKALIDSNLPLEMFLKSCEATPTPNPMDRLYYRFIEDGCAVDDTVRFESQARLKTRFSVEAFAFLDHFTSDSIFVHCDIEARDVGNAQECEPVDANASKRRRRRHACRGSSTGLSTGVVNSEGPIRIVRSPDSDFTAVKENVPSITQQSPFVPAFISVTAIILCILLIALVVAMATVVRNLKVENRRLAKFVGSPNPIPLKSITDP